METKPREMTKDTLLTFKGTKAVVTKKGANGFQYSMNTEQANALLAELARVVDSPNGVKLAVYTSEKEGERGAFLSSFGFISAIQDRPGFGAKTTVSTKPSANPISAETAAKIAKLKGQA